MANTLAIKPLDPQCDIVLERMRSTDFDPVVVWERYGDVLVVDETDDDAVRYALTDSGRTNRVGDRIVRVDDDPEAEGGALWHARRDVTPSRSAASEADYINAETNRLRSR